MSAIQSFTAKDVCGALGGISRSKLHLWAQLTPFCDRPSRERSARRYTKADLLTLAVLHALEEFFDVKLSGRDCVSAAIHQYVRSPRYALEEEWIFIPLDGGAAYSVQDQKITAPGWVVDVARERERIDIYLGLTPPQQELPLISNIKSGRQ